MVNFPRTARLSGLVLSRSTTVSLLSRDSAYRQEKAPLGLAKQDAPAGEGMPADGTARINIVENGTTTRPDCKATFETDMPALPKRPFGSG